MRGSKRSRNRSQKQMERQLKKDLMEDFGNEFVSSGRGDRYWEKKRQAEAERNMRNSHKGGSHKRGSNYGRKQCGRKKLKKPFRILKNLLKILIALVLLIFVYISIIALKMDHNALDRSSLGIDSDVARELWGYKNIAILGVDTRDMDDMEGSRTDSIIIMSIDKRTNKTVLTSVYRDSFMDLGEHGYSKITNAFAYGGPDATISALNRNMDLNIKNYVAVNFETVYNLVEGLGGVEVDVKDYEIKELNKYIDDSAAHIEGADIQYFTEPGTQTINGIQAVSYARIRKVGGGDYERSERMRTLFSAVAKKAKHTNPFKLNRAIMKTAPYISTNMNSLKMLPLALRYLFMDIEIGEGWPYEKSGYSGAAWFCVPDTLEDNVTEFHEKIFHQNSYTPSSTVVDINSNIIMKTGIQ